MPTQLAIFLAQELEQRNWTLRMAAEESGVSRSALDNILKNEDVTPTLETLSRLGHTFKLPLWRLVEMAGFDLEFKFIQAERTVLLMSRLNRGLTDRLLNLSPNDVIGVHAYLDALDRIRAAKES